MHNIRHLAPILGISLLLGACANTPPEAKYPRLGRRQPRRRLRRRTPRPMPPRAPLRARAAERAGGGQCRSGRRHAWPARAERTVYFGFDEYTIDSRDADLLGQHARYLSADPDRAGAGRGSCRRARQHRIQPRARPASCRGGAARTRARSGCPTRGSRRPAGAKASRRRRAAARTPGRAIAAPNWSTRRAERRRPAGAAPPARSTRAGCGGSRGGASSARAESPRRRRRDRVRRSAPQDRLPAGRASPRRGWPAPAAARR